MNVDKIVAAAGGVAIGVGGTLLTQKLIKDAALKKVSSVETQETIVEPDGAIAYREASVKLNAPHADVKNSTSQTLTSLKPTAKSTEPKKAAS